jgi:transcription initiation factor IIE alpha subunit
MPSLTPTTTTTTTSEAAQTQTASAKDLVAAVARAFYDDATICLVDYLLRSKYLQDGPGMGKRLHLSTKQVRAKLLFLQAEHLASCESVAAIVETRDRIRTYRRPRTAKFWYIDLNRAMHTISLRLQLFKRKLEQARNDACNTSHYVCPGYSLKACNGYYTELEAQSLEMDETTGQFLCRECHEVHMHNPNPPPHSYTLDVVDTKEDRRRAEELLNRYHSQLPLRKDEHQRATTPTRNFWLAPTHS